jgi:isopenicillin-N epimerase
MLLPLVVSPGWPGCAFNPLPEGKSPLVHYQEYQGTRDISAFLAVSAAIDYMKTHDWEAQRQRCHGLAAETLGRICALNGMEPFSPTTWDFMGQFVSAPLPKGDLTRLIEKMKARKIVVPIFPLPQIGLNCIRVSFQAYNDERDLEILMEVLKEEYAG